MAIHGDVLCAYGGQEVWTMSFTEYYSSSLKNTSSASSLSNMLFYISSYFLRETNSRFTIQGQIYSFIT